MKKTHIIIISIISLLILTSCQEKISDQEKFVKEFPKTQEYNSFTYIDINKANEILENDTGIIYIGYPESECCQEYAPIINQVADVEGVDKIYYLNILKDEQKNTNEYQKFKSKLKSIINLNNETIEVPLTIGVLNGKIIEIEQEISNKLNEINTCQEYFNTDNVTKLKLKLSEIFNKVHDDNCNDCKVK